MKNLITILTACLITINTIPMVSGQTFQKTFGGLGNEKANSIQQTLDGGFIITGGTENFAPTAPDVYLIKTDANGDTMWTKTFGGDSIDEGWAVQQTADLGYIIAGETWSFGAASQSVYLVKTDAGGNAQWSKIYGGCCNQAGWSVQQTADLGYIITGFTGSFGAGGVADVYLIKTDALGDTLWTKTYGESGTDVGRSVQQTADLGYIITGQYYNPITLTANVVLIKTDVNGDTLWTKTYGGIYVEGGNSVQQTADNGYIITGNTVSFSGIPGSISNLYLIKTNSLGDTLWTKSFGVTDNDGGTSVRQTIDGGYIVSGYSYDPISLDHDVYLIRTDANGDTLWTRTFGGTVDDFGNSVWETSDSGFVIAGQTNSFGAGGDDVFLIRTDANGNSGGCYQGNPATTVISPATVVNSTTAQVGFGPAIVVSPPTIVNSTSTLVRGTISGTVTDTAGNAIANGVVKLLQFINDSTRMDPVNTAPIIAGNYIFNNMDAGEYYIVAEDWDSIVYPNRIPTYYGNTHRWDSAWVNNVFCGSDIVLIETPMWTMGTGFCSGRITYGVKNKTGKFLGDPMPGLDITIEQIPGGEIKQFTTTNDSGEYSFGNIPTSMWGYNLFVDIPGLTMDSTYDVMIVNPTDSINDLDFMVDTTSGSGVIFIATTPTSIRDIIIQPSYNVKVFPNPFSDATRFEIEGGGEGESYRLEIDDIMGRNVKLIDNISITIELNRGELTPGLYIYKVLNEEGLIGLGKLVVQ